VRAQRGGRHLLAALLVLAVLPAVAALAGCGVGAPERAAGPTATAQAVSPAAAFPFTLSGSEGTSVRLAKAPERIVSLSPGTTETLFAIGAGSAVVAVDRFSDYPEATKTLPKVEYTRPNVESLAALKPDLIIGSGRQKDMVAAMQNAGLPFVLLDEPGTVAGVLERIRLLGRATGHGEAADQLARQLEARIRALSEKLADVAQGPRVFHEISGTAGIYTATSRSFVGDLYTLLKARNIADAAVGPYPQLSQEVIIQADPEVIVLADGREGVTVEQVRGRPGWSGISAVKNQRVYLLSDVQADLVSRPGPRVVDGLELLAKVLYPDKF
jgi:iron complex transport system substrate-binding protein